MKITSSHSVPKIKETKTEIFNQSVFALFKMVCIPMLLKMVCITMLFKMVYIPMLLKMLCIPMLLKMVFISVPCAWF